MTDTDKAEFWQLLKGVHEFYRVDTSPFAGRVWWNACKGFSLEQVTKAFDAHLVDPKAGQFMPKPADIVKALQGTHEDRSLIAWGKAFDAIQRVGQYRSVAFDDPVIHAVIEDLGGWVKFCQIDYDELPFVQKRFADAYRAYAQKGAAMPFSGRLSGLAEQNNKFLGYASEIDLVAIGDPGRVQEVMRLGSAGGGKARHTPIAQLAKDALPQLEGGKA